jgi:hypothetical protein
MVGVGLNLFVHHTNCLYNPINSKAEEEREQLSKGKQLRDKRRDQFTYIQAIEQEIE